MNSVYSLYLKYTLSCHSTLREKCSFSDSCSFCLLYSTTSAPMCLVTCWKYKQSHIIISPCRNDPSRLQNCRTKRFFTVFGTLRVTWRQRREILSPTHPHTPKQRMFSLFLQVRMFHPVWHVRHCTASTVVPKYGPHLVDLMLVNKTLQRRSQSKKLAYRISVTSINANRKKQSTERASDSPLQMWHNMMANVLPPFWVPGLSRMCRTSSRESNA